MLRLILIIGVTIVLLMAGVASAHARGGHAGPIARPQLARPAPRAQQVVHPEAARPPAPPPQVHTPAPEAPRGEAVRGEAPGGAALQHSGRLTPDERKALRRQIDEARDLYRPPLQRRP
jgi:hypothetical protein